MVNGSRFFRSKDAFEVKSLFGQQVIHKDGDRTWERMFHWRMVTLTLAPLSSSTSVCSLSETHLLSILAIWKRVSSTTGTAYSARLSIYDSIQITAAGFWQHTGLLKLLSGKSPPMSKSLFSCLSGFNKHRLSLNLIGVKGTNCRNWNAMLLHFFLGHRHQSESESAVALRRHESYCLLGLLSHTTARASCCFQQLWITLKKLKGGTADNISISLIWTRLIV